MKEKWFKKSLVFGFVVTLLFTVLAVIPQPVHAATITNNLIGEYTVFSQNYTVKGVTNNMFIANYLETTSVENATLTYDSAEKAVKYHTWLGNTMQLYIGKLYPAVHTTYTIKLSLATDSYADAMNMYIGNEWITIKYADSAMTQYYIRANYYNSTGALITTLSATIPKVTPLTLNIEWNGENKTTHITCAENSTVNIWAPATFYDVQQLPYPALSWSFVYIYTTFSTGGTYTDVYLYELKQTVPRYTITALPRNNLMAFGFDGPHDYFTYTQKGMEYLKANKFKATLFFDNGTAYGWYTNTTYQKIYKDYLNNYSWEAGIHFHEALATLSYVNATKAIDTEVGYVQTVFGVTPTTWCSLSNNDNITHAQYIWTNYKSYWRNSHNMITAIANIGGVKDTTWNNFWQIAVQHGFTYPVFIHHTDLTTNDDWGISYENFTKFVDDEKKNGVIITSYIDYIKTNMNQIDFYATNIEKTDYYIKFTAHTNGAKAYVDVNWDSTKYVKVVDLTTGKEVSWYPGSVAFWVQDGHTYEVYYVIQKSIDTSIELISMIIMLGIVGSVMAVFKKSMK